MKLGDKLAWILAKLLGAKPCSACKARQEALNMVDTDGPLNEIVVDCITAMAHPFVMPSVARQRAVEKLVRDKTVREAKW